MDNITKFLSNPIWNGIQGLITLVMFLIYLWGTRQSWIPFVKLFAHAILLFSVGLATSTLIFFVFDLTISRLMIDSPPNLRISIVLALRLSFLTSSVPTIIAMASKDSTDSVNRTAIASAVYFPISLIVLLHLSQSTLASFAALFGLLMGLSISGFIFGILISLSITRARRWIEKGMLIFEKQFLNGKPT